MRRAKALRRCAATYGWRFSRSQSQVPLIRIQDSTFYRHHPNSSTHLTASQNPPLFSKLNFALHSTKEPLEHWAVIGPSSSGKTTFLQILQGRHLCIPPDSRTFPFLTESSPAILPSQAIKYVGFGGEQQLGQQALQSAYLSARYESRREATDFEVARFLRGDVELNPQDDHGREIDDSLMSRVIRDLNLEELLQMPVSNLSNGQTRRARIARALLTKPELLLLDEPFMGLDPKTILTLSPLLFGLAERCQPRLLLTLRPQDPIPEWITNLVLLGGNCEVLAMGEKGIVLRSVRSGMHKEEMVMQAGKSLARRGVQDIDLSESSIGHRQGHHQLSATNAKIEDVKMSSPIAFPLKTTRELSRDGYLFDDASSPPAPAGEPLVEMEGAHVQYGRKSVLGNWTQEISGIPRSGLWWTIRRGERWGIFGSNGSGKTTILSLICSDHPQTYSLPIQLFGRSRLPQPGRSGISIFDIQARIGHSSPEIHNHIPKFLSLREVLENAWSDTFRGRPKLSEDASERVDACLRWFEQDLRPGFFQGSQCSTDAVWASHVLFGGLPFSAQKVALFLRAVIKEPDIVILDEAFSGMDDLVRDRCLLFLAWGETKNYDPRSGVRYSSPERRRDIYTSPSIPRAKLRGLNEEQALLCISHVKEEIPGSVREWICLPEANTGKPARFGRLKGPIEGDYDRWNEIWGV